MDLATMEQYDREASQDSEEFNGSADYSGYVLDLNVPCNTNSPESTSLNSVSQDVDMGKKSANSDEISPWKDALISRNLDLVNCCLLAMLDDLPSSDQPYIGLLMKTVLKEVDDITVGKEEPIAESIITKLLATLTTMDSNEKPNQSPAIDIRNVDLEKNSSFSVKIPEKSICSLEAKVPRKYNSLAATNTGSSFVCPGCERLIHNKSYCSACLTLVSRIERHMEIGDPAPTCSHEGFEGAPKCRCCRYNKYNEYWRYKKRRETRINGKDLCLGCQAPLNKGATGCRPCHAMVRAILKARNRGRPVPQCHHKNLTGSRECRNCRFHRYLKQRGILPFKCGSCFELCATSKCESCYSFGISLEKTFGANAIPCCSHKNRDGAPSCLNCRYHLWKEGKVQPLEEFSDKLQEKDSNIELESVLPSIKSDPEMDVKPDVKRIKIEEIPFEFEMA